MPDADVVRGGPYGRGCVGGVVRSAVVHMEHRRFRDRGNSDPYERGPRGVPCIDFVRNRIACGILEDEVRSAAEVRIVETLNRPGKLHEHGKVRERGIAAVSRRREGYSFREGAVRVCSAERTQRCGQQKLSHIVSFHCLGVREFRCDSIVSNASGTGQLSAGIRRVIRKYTEVAMHEQRELWYTLQ